MSIGKDNRGDTIVEVLVSIAVVSTVLAGAFVSANRSLSGSQQSQERTEAVKHTEEQLERLKTEASNPSTSVFTSTNSFCFDTSGTLTTMPFVVNPDPALDNFSSYLLECLRTPEDRYHTAITRSGNNFTATTRWERAGGGGRDEVRMVYRVYP